jgi:hypothetical protein
MNLEQVLELAAKYGPTIIKIVQADGPVIQAFLKDLQALKAGQAPSAVVPPIQPLAAPAGWPKT